MPNKKTFLNVSDQNKAIIEEHIKYRASQKYLPPKSQLNIKNALKKLADYSYHHLQNKSIKNLTKEELIEFFSPDGKHVTIGSRDIYATHIIEFYRWVDDIDEPRIRPKRMTFYRRNNTAQKRRQIDPDFKEMHLITPNDYGLILKHSNDVLGQNEALWETLYLSGARPSEVAHLQIKNIKVEDDSNVLIKIDKGESKTIPRKIPLPEQPHKLLRWLGNHPFKDDKDALLWVSEKTGKPLDLNPRDPSDFIARRFRALKKRCPDVKNSLSPKSFRKNRATILFTQSDSKDSDINLNNVAQIMGWTYQTVTQRYNEYGLFDFDDLKKKVFSDKTIPIDYDSQQRIIKKQAEKLEFFKTKDVVTKKQHNKDMKKLLNEQIELLKFELDSFKQTAFEYMNKEIEEDYQKNPQVYHDMRDNEKDLNKDEKQP